MEKIIVSSLPVFDEIPAGWGVIKGTLTAPCGYEFINNRKSRFSHEYQQGLVKCVSEPQKAPEEIVLSSSSDKSASSSIFTPDETEKGFGGCFSDEPELPGKLNQLAREETKLRLLRDIAADIVVCKMEGWDYKCYLHELKAEIERFL